jgi:hypothetical protein
MEVTGLEGQTSTARACLMVSIAPGAGRAAYAPSYAISRISG